MDFGLSKTEVLFQQMIRSFAENEVKPLAAEIDEEERFPIETVEKMGKLGIMGIPVPTQYGGAGGNYKLYAMAVEELSRCCATTGIVVSAHTSLCIGPILEYGTEEQKMKYLPNLFPYTTLFRSRWSPSRTAVVCCPDASVPALGSVRPKAPIH